jgi:hypothetical protein
MVAKEVFVNYYNFNPFWVHPRKEVLVLKSKKVIVKVSSEPGLEPETELELEPKEIISAPQHW